MHGGGGECESTGTGPGAEQCCQTYQRTILICTVYFCQMQGGGGECESTGTGPGAEQRGRADGGTRGAATGTFAQSCTVYFHFIDDTHLKISLL